MEIIPYIPKYDILLTLSKYPMIKGDEVEYMTKPAQFNAHSATEDKEKIFQAVADGEDFLFLGEV